MSYENITLYIPDELKAKIDAGMLTMAGSVVRDHAGRIVAHLGEGTPAEKATAGAAALALVAARKHPLLLAGAAGASALTVAAAAVNLPGYLRLQRALDAYLAAAQNQQLDTDVIDALLTELAPAHDTRWMPWGFGASHMRQLTAAIGDYTARLQRAHNTPSTDLVPLPADDGKDATITDLRPYLQAQRDLLAARAS